MNDHNLNGSSQHVVGDYDFQSSNSQQSVDQNVNAPATNIQVYNSYVFVYLRLTLTSIYFKLSLLFN